MDIYEELSKSPPLIKKVCEGNIVEVRQILEAGIGKVSDRDCCNNSALHCAVGYRHFDIVELLLELGADVNSIGMYGRTPIYNAIDDSDFEMVKLLVDKGADLTVKGEKNRDVILYCTRYLRADRMKILKYVIDNIKLTDKYGILDLKESLFYYYKPEEEQQQLQSMFKDVLIKFSKNNYC